MKERIYVGIDPDINLTGVSTFKSSASEKIKLYSMDLVEFRKLCYKLAEDCEPFFYVECWDQNELSGYIASNLHALRSKIGLKNAIYANAKTAISSGRNMQVGREYIKVIKDFNFDYKVISPKARERMDKKGTLNVSAEELEESILNQLRKGRNVYPSKLDANRFKKLLNVKSGGNEDKRDAALLLSNEFIIEKYNLNNEDT